MEFKKRYTDKAEWLIDIFFVIGVLLIVTGLFVHWGERPQVLPQIFIDAGTGMALASIAAFFLK